MSRLRLSQLNGDEEILTIASMPIHMTMRIVDNIVHYWGHQQGYDPADVFKDVTIYVYRNNGHARHHKSGRGDQPIQAKHATPPVQAVQSMARWRDLHRRVVPRVEFCYSIMHPKLQKHVVRTI